MQNNNIYAQWQPQQRRQKYHKSNICASSNCFFPICTEYLNNYANNIFYAHKLEMWMSAHADVICFLKYMQVLINQEYVHYFIKKTIICLMIHRLY